MDRTHRESARGYLVSIHRCAASSGEGTGMSRKDYVKFADMLKEAHGNCSIDNPGECAAVNTIAFETAKIFHVDNPAFDPYRFFIACGYGKETAASMANRV